MKALGIKNRCRVYEIPKNVKYITAMPQMRKYMKVSAEIYSVYLNYISPDDIYVYSIDECFIDVTDYCRLYKKTPGEIAVMLMNAVYDETGICSATGIGTNLFLYRKFRRHPLKAFWRTLQTHRKYSRHAARKWKTSVFSPDRFYTYSQPGQSV